MRSCSSSQLQRRSFLQVGSLSLMGLGLPSLFASERLRDSGRRGGRPSARNVIMVWLSGGPSTIDMWDLKPTANARIRGEFEPIPTSADGVAICEHLPLMAKQMSDCTLVRSVSHTIAEHGQGSEFVSTGNPINPALKYPSMGSIVSNQMTVSRAVPSYLEIQGTGYGGAGYLGAAYNPFEVQPLGLPRRTPVRDRFALSAGTTGEDLGRKASLLRRLEGEFRGSQQSQLATEMSTFQQQAIDILGSGKTRAALDLSRETEQARQRYGFGLGSRALAARRLIEAGARFVTIGFQGWDTHSKQFWTTPHDLAAAIGSSPICVGRRPEIARAAGRHDRLLRGRVQSYAGHQ